jgi:hypothetical protein
MRHESSKRSSAVRVLSIALIAVALASCSSKLSTAEWETEWNGLLGDLPTLDAVTGASDAALSEICTEALGTLRTAAVDLMRAPEPDLERTALTYVDFAESVFFECPIRTGDHTGFEAGFEEMDRLQTAVEAILDFDE